ncbi:MAG: RluA family pseudouridine synthase [Candidatus Kaiserbacteria bacterium]|nr:RluA family pseudouridine synthase [Candidatus Kaiserbacteria bacterium]MCB9816428.1 RluA family pseudouridine synthase [Candidatus Nomurabacteria bacterium]
MNLVNDGKENNLEPTVIYEDDAVLVISKPYGWLTHEDGKTEAPTVVEWFLRWQPSAASVGEPGYSPQGTELNRSGVVHRLDRETSGILILAKTQEAHQYLKKLFKDRAVYKEYRALVYGRMNDRWGTINRPIGRSAKDSRRRSAERGAKGVRREAITDFERIGMGEYQDEPFSYVKLIPKTGRTHQLRVHLRAIDRPIVMDGLYASHKIDGSNNLELERLALHAHVLELTLPSGEEQRFIAPVPPEIEQAVDRIQE